MSLGLELERNIRDAWQRLREKILSDPQELQKRLARRRLRTLTQPPRAWCIAIRASDRRITPAHWVIHPEHALELDHPEHPYEPIEHEVTIQTHAIRRYCGPVSFSREDAQDVAKMLGVSRGMLRYARSRGMFYETRYPRLGGKPGKAVPLLDGGGKLLDPGYANFNARPHPIWGSQWEFLSRMFPEGFEQTVIRRPVFKRMDGVKVPAPTVDSHALTPALSRREREEDPHPNPLPAYRERGQEGREREYPDEMQHFGWRWVCPVCKKEVRTIYYPVPVRTLFDYGEFVDPVIQLKLCDADLPERPPGMFACVRCHGVYYFSSVTAGGWGQAIAYLTAGMLYGREVAKPASFVPERKRVRTRRLSGCAPVREKVLTRLRLGWSNFEIAREMGKTINAVRCSVAVICRQEGVKDVQGLAKKLQFAVVPPLNRVQRARERRAVVLEMMLRDCTHVEMIQAMATNIGVLEKDIKTIYRQHGIKGKAHIGRRELAAKLGRAFVARLEYVPGGSGWGKTGGGVESAGMLRST